MKQRLFDLLSSLFVIFVYLVVFGPLVFLASDEIYRTYTNPYEIGQRVRIKTNDTTGRVVSRYAYGVQIKYVDDIRAIHERYFELDEVTPR